MRPRLSLWRALRVLFGLAGAGFLVVAFLETWDESRGAPFPGWWRLASAVALLTIGLLCGARAWAALLRRPLSRQLMAGFFMSQLGKYVPGAVWQAVGQVGYAARLDVPVHVATVAFAVFAITQAAAGGFLGSGVALFIPEAPLAVRLASLAGLGLLVLLNRPWLTAAVRRLARWRGVNGAGLVPPAGAILRASAWSVCTLVFAGLAFAVVLNGLEDISVVDAVVVFALAWTVGFLAVPFPAGLGVREAILIAALGYSVAAGALVAASVFLRLCFMAAETLAIVLAQWLVVREGKLERIAERSVGKG